MHQQAAHRVKLSACGAMLLLAYGCAAGDEQGTVPQLPSMLDPASPDALGISNFTWLIHAIMGVVFVGVLSALLFIYRRFRARSETDQGRRAFGHTRLEIGWTAAPALIVFATFLVSLNVMCTVGAQAGTGPQAASAPVRVVVNGRLWWWEYRLPDYGVVTANELHLPLGRPVRLELRSDEVMHNWWVPQLTGKRYLIPGKVNELGFTPSELGVFGGACGEFCGIQHAWMRLRVVVEAEPDFEAWASNEAQPARTPATALAQRGQALFASSTCSSCHAVEGQAGQGARAGPSLTHFGNRATLAAGVLRNSPENLSRWLSAPQSVKPGNLMPNTPLAPEEIEALTAYLLELQ